MTLQVENTVDLDNTLQWLKTQKRYYVAWLFVLIHL